MTKREYLTAAELLNDGALNGVTGGSMDGVPSGHLGRLGAGAATLPTTGVGGGLGGGSTITPGGSGGAPSGIQPK